MLTIPNYTKKLSGYKNLIARNIFNAYRPKATLNKEKCKISFVNLCRISTFVAESWQSGRMRRS